MNENTDTHNSIHIGVRCHFTAVWILISLRVSVDKCFFHMPVSHLFVFSNARFLDELR